MLVRARSAPTGRVGVNCPRCRRSAGPDDRFCGECGASLARGCTGCGREVSADARFCPGCGRSLAAQGEKRSAAQYTPRHLAERILRHRSAMEGERKQVTVLFVDVEGSIALAEQIDPELWHRIMDRFFAIMSRGVHRFEGSINQFTGDGIMALFGAPIAHEDHAQRACHAALELRQSVRRYADELRSESGLNFSVRLGLNSGDVVVGRIGDDLRMDYTAHGHTVGIASRMEAVAEPGTIYLGEPCARIVSDYFDLRNLGALRLKGVSEPVRAFELRGPGRMRTRLDVARLRGFSRFVGRDAEIELAETALRDALRGRCGALSIVGEAGVGKSRLCAELADRCRSRGIAVYAAHCPSYARNVPFLPILELLAELFGTNAEDPPQRVREKVAGRLLLHDEAFRDSLPLIFDFLGVPDPDKPAPSLDPETRQTELRAFLRRLVARIADREAIVLFFDDLHWIDPASDALLAELASAASESRCLVLANYRPEYPAAWRDAAACREIDLPPLGAGPVQELLRELLGPHPSLSSLHERIDERARGNPYFIEELVRHLAETGELRGEPGAYRAAREIEGPAVPATIQNVLAARIARLDDRDKALLQAAAVLGKRFSVALLRALSGLTESELESTLGRLRESEFLYPEPRGAEPEWAFKHPLGQEVAYAAQLSERRGALHGAAARSLEAQCRHRPERADTWAALIAHHFDAAGELDCASRWHRRAAERAALDDRSEAVRHWRRVREIAALGQDDEEACDQRLAACEQILQLGQRTGLSLDEARELFEEGRALAERRRNPRALALLTHAVTRQQTGDIPAWRELAVEAAALAEQTGDPRLCAWLQVDVANATMHQGELTAGLAIVDQHLETMRRERSLRQGRHGERAFEGHSWFRGILLMQLGRLEEAEAQFGALVAHARETRSRETLRNALSGRAEVRVAAGELGAAMRDARESRDLAELLATPYHRAWADHMLGVVLAAEGRFAQARAALEAALRTGRESRTTLFNEAFVLADLAEAHLGDDETARAGVLAREAVALALRQHARLRECRAQLALARVALGEGEPAALARADAALERARALAVAMRACVLEAQVRESLAALAGQRGDREARGAELRAAHELYAGMGAQRRAARAAEALAAP